MEERPTRQAADIAHTIAKAGFASIPLVGGSAAEIFSAIVTPPLSRRRDRWIELLADRLKSLEERVQGFRLETLSENEAFITTMMHASQVAMRNHQEEKLEALRNAILNTALPNPPEEDLQQMFLNFVDTFTTWHIRLLKFFDDPRKWGQDHGITFPEWKIAGSLRQVLECAFLEMHGKRDIYDPIVSDLYTRSLMSTHSVHTSMTAQGLFASRTTDIGKRFIKFITPPTLPM